MLVDGHHRTVAARTLGCQEIDSYVIDLQQELKLGMEKTADLNGIFSLEPIINNLSRICGAPKSAALSIE